MRKLLLSIVFLLASSIGALAQNVQCADRPSNDSSNACANTRFVQTHVTPPGGTSGQIQYNNGGAFGGFTANGDCTINTATGAVLCTKVNSVAYSASPATDTVPLVTGTNQTTYTAIPNCTTGSLQYNSSTKLFICNASSGSGTVSIAGTGLNLSGTGGNTVNLNVPVIAADGGTGVVSPTANTIPINQGSSAQTNTGVGSTGQYVGGNTGTAPTYKTGPWTFIASASVPASSSTITLPTVFSGGYAEYEIEFDSVSVSATGVTNLELRVYSGGSLQTTGYVAQIMGSNGATVSTTSSTTGIPVRLRSSGANGNPGASGMIRVMNPQTTAQPKIFYGSGGFFNSTTGFVQTYNGSWNNTAAVDGIQIYVDTGNINTGTIKVYARN